LTKKKGHKIVIGRKDIADFPDIGFNQVEVKTDTGAYTSSIHCSKLYVEDAILYCNFLDEKHPEYSLKTHSFTDFRTITVKSSNGIAENRYEIKTRITIFKKDYSIALSLSDRSDMKFPVLLGRKFMNSKFIVDPALLDLSFNNKIYEFKNTL